MQGGSGGANTPSFLENYFKIMQFLNPDSLYILPASVAQFDAPSDWRPGGRGFNPR